MPERVIDVYRRYEVPPNLQRHLLRVAAVAELVQGAWRGPALDRERLRRVLLLHDVGNIVKADYVALPHLLEEEQPRVAHWLAVQRGYHARFGRDAGLATRGLAREIGLGDDELSLLDRMDFMRNEETVAGRDYHVKLAAYADQRVGPFGILSLSERLAEAKARYRADPGAFMASPRAARLIEHAHEIEAQIFECCGLEPHEIDDASAAPVIAALRSFEL